MSAFIYTLESREQGHYQGTLNLIDSDGETETQLIIWNFNTSEQEYTIRRNREVLLVLEGLFKSDDLQALSQEKREVLQRADHWFQTFKDMVDRECGYV